jgi:hypothetical protein
VLTEPVTATATLDQRNRFMLTDSASTGTSLILDPCNGITGWPMSYRRRSGPCRSKASYSSDNELAAASSHFRTAAPQ